MQRELKNQINDVATSMGTMPAPPTTPSRSARGSTSMSSSPAASSVLGPPMPPRSRVADAATQTVINDEYVPILEYLDRDVPAPVPVREWHPGPVYVSPHGDTFHAHERC